MKRAVGADLALINDSSAFCAVGAEDGIVTVRELLELRPSRGAPLKLSDVCTRATAFAQRHGCRTIMVDHHLIEAAREHMREGVLLEACDGGQQAKIETYVFLRDLIANGKLRIPAKYFRLRQQLKDVVSRPTPGGGLTLTSPRRGGAHGDCVSALVLACWQTRFEDESVLMQQVDESFRRGERRSLEPPMPDHNGTRWGGTPGKGWG